MQQEMTEKWKQYKITHLESKRTKLFARLIRKSSDIDTLIYSYQNGTTLRDTPMPYSIWSLRFFRRWRGVNDQYNEELWFDEVNQRITFKHKIHNWLKESEEKSKSERLSGGSSRTGFKPNSLQSSKSSEVSAYKNLIKKHKVGELEAAACFIRTKTDAKYQSHSLKVKEQLFKV